MGQSNTTGFISTVVRWPSRRCTFGEFESLAVASRRSRYRWRMLEQLLRHLRLRHKNPAWASGGPAGSNVWRYAWSDVAQCSCAARHAAERFTDRACAGSVRLTSSATRNADTWEREDAPQIPKYSVCPRARVLLSPPVM